MSAKLNPQLAHLLQLAAKMKAEKAAQSAQSAQSAQQAPVQAPAAAALNIRVNLTGIAAAVCCTAAVPAPGQQFAIPYNAQQLEAIALAGEGKGFCLVGAAGTGKTTTIMQVVASALETLGASAIAVCAFTRRAVRNTRKACRKIPDERTAARAVERCSTIHALLKFAPVDYEYITKDGGVRTTSRFEPQYRETNPLTELRLVIIDEASMVGLDLWKQLLEACPNAVFVFIGDLNQLKPVFGLPVFGYKMQELPVVELTQVYRQALESPIVRFQYDYTLRGRTPSDRQLEEVGAAGAGLSFQFLTKHREPGEQCRVFATYLKKEYEAGRYQPVKHAVLIPNRKLRGTSGNELFSTEGTNRWVAQWIGEERGAVVHHVRAGVRELFLAVGDYVVFGAEDYFIESVSNNRKYTGRPCMEPSVDLTRLGWYKGRGNAQHLSEEEDFGALLALAGSEGESNACSHMVMLVPANGADSLEAALAASDTNSQPLALTSIGDFNESKFNLGYCISVHQAQGSEWEKVYFVLTHHARNLRTRELLYTGMTRAAKELVVVCSPSSKSGAMDSSVAKAIESQMMPGIGWRNKVKYFAERREEYEAFMAVPTVYGPEGFKDSMDFNSASVAPTFSE